MPEERPAVEDRIDARLGRIETHLVEMDKRLTSDVAGLKAGFDQMDKRVSNVESLQRWGIGLTVTVLLALVGLILTVVTRLP